MTDFISSSWWGILGLILTLTFGTLSIYQYFKSRRFKQVVFTCLFSTLQMRNHPDISIAFKGNEINSLSKLLVLCWNSGTEEIRSTDIPSGECPSIVFRENARVLSFKVLEQSSPGLNFTIEQLSERTLNVKFEYLNPKDGCMIEILYEKLIGASITVDLSAQIIGGRQTLERRYERGTGGSFIFVGLLVSAALFVFSAFILFIDASVLSAIGGSSALIMAGICVYIAWRNAKSYMTKQVPNFALKYFEGKS